MKKIVNYIIINFRNGLYIRSDKEDSIQFNKISTEILNNGKGYNELRELTKI
jgi:hypothetical protein